MADPMTTMIEAAKNPANCLNELRSTTGRPVMFVMPMYFPREVLDAAGFIPAEIWGSEKPLSASGEFLQPTICSLVIGVFELGLSGELGELAGAVFPSTCDTVQNSEGLWASRFPDGFTGHVVLPKITSAKGAAEFIEAQIREYMQELKARTGDDVTDEALSEAIARGNRARAAARVLLDMGLDGRLSAKERNAVFVLYNLMPFDEFASLAEQAAEQIRSREPDTAAEPVLVSGMVLGPQSVVDLYDSLGARIVDDDLGIGRRSIDPDVDRSGDPVAALAARHLARRPCCTFHHSGKDRAADLIDQVKGSKAKGVVFSRLKFCDPEAFDYPYLSGALKGAGISSVLLEIELGTLSLEAVTTRLQAFLESL